MYSPGVTTKPWVQWSQTDSGWLVAAGSKDRHLLRRPRLKPDLGEADQSLGRLALDRHAEVDLHDLGAGDVTGVASRRSTRSAACRRCRSAASRHVGELEGRVRQAETEREQRLDALRLEPAVADLRPSV